jgi:TPR repeat protein/putative methionine-R-sulfoxide reductase with GAF domain
MYQRDLRSVSMAAVTSVMKSTPPNRRRRVRHKIQTPAYATFTGDSRGAMLDLHQILNISEEGVSIQCDAALELGRRINLCLDLAECPDHIYTTGQVVWSSATGRSGLRFAELPPFSLFRLREWLFFNAMTAVATANDMGVTMPYRPELAPPRPSYSDTLAAVTAVQREVEALGPDLSAALRLIAARAQTLIHASAIAIALVDSDPQFMICRANAGADAPPVGAKLQVGSGFSGECVHSGRLSRCDDTETDSRVDPEGCRALGIRSMLAVPLRAADKTIGIVEAFSGKPNTFSENDEKILQRLSETVYAAVNRAARAESLPALPPAPAPNTARFSPTPGSVLFASAPVRDKEMKANDSGGFSGISLPRSHLILLIATAAVIALVLGYHSAPLIQAKLQERGHTQLQTVLASSQPPKSANAAGPSVDTATLDQLRQMADNGDPAAQNALGLRYATGDGVRPDDHQALNWFTKAAEQGYIPAQSKLGSVYYRGRDIPQNFSQAYFWMVLARASGDDTSKTLAPLVASHLTRDQIASIESDAGRWLQEHTNAKPVAAR